MTGQVGFPIVIRTVTLSVVDANGAALGTLPPFPVELPHPIEVAEVVSGARSRFGVEVAVLRLLEATDTACAYLVETSALPDRYRGPVAVDLSPHPLRSPYARPGGPSAAVHWAERELAGRGRALVTAHQIRTWNLSAIWRLDTASLPAAGTVALPTAGTAWLKAVPEFFAHEPAVLAFAAEHGPAGLVPPLLASTHGRMLLEHVPGRDLYGADLAVRKAIAAAVHPLHTTAVAHADRLVAAGVPDRRGPALLALLTEVVTRYGHGEPRLARLVAGLPDRLAELAGCGLPDTLVHGDLHPGNVRGADPAGALVVIDWGDSVVSNPGFDVLRLAGGLDPVGTGELIDDWAQRWLTERPDSNPVRAVELLRPVAALYLAAVYMRFLDQIEPSEYPHHAQDVPDWLGRAAALVESPM
jgi:hypothetical protein